MKTAYAYPNLLPTAYPAMTRTNAPAKTVASTGNARASPPHATTALSAPSTNAQMACAFISRNLEAALDHRGVSPLATIPQRGHA